MESDDLALFLAMMLVSLVAVVDIYINPIR
jgi:hypothetical protein